MTDMGFEKMICPRFSLPSLPPIRWARAWGCRWSTTSSSPTEEMSRYKVGKVRVQNSPYRCRLKTNQSAEFRDRVRLRENCAKTRSANQATLFFVESKHIYQAKEQMPRSQIIWTVRA